VGIVTNIGTVHAERAGSQEMIAKGKVELFENLPPSPLGTAIVNVDDPWVRWMMDKTRADLLTYSQETDADITARNIVGLGLDGIEFTLSNKERTQRIRVPIIGTHSIMTILRAAAAGFAMGLTWDEVITGLQTSTSQLRLTAVKSNTGALILDDTYNATPESTVAALNLLGEIKGRRIAVLGDMFELGQYEKSGHELVGIVASKTADELITVGNRAKIIAESALANGFPSSRITCTDTISEAIDILLPQINQGDIVLIKGSHGLRMDRIVREIEASA
jgi:UDP-N-acetylmuramoyl-tripeptide--D-alanyl-D-alanine ligase